LDFYNNIGTNQTLLTRGTSATWSPDSKYIAFHASDSYYDSGGEDTGTPIKDDPGAATTDSDLFVANVDELAAAHDVLTKTQLATNITNTPDQIEDDADWSASTTTAPDGLIVFTSHPVTDNPNNSTHAEIYVINPDWHRAAPAHRQRLRRARALVVPGRHPDRVLRPHRRARPPWRG
jgi:hypothetical protein